MKQIIFVLSVIAMLTSCTTVRFASPQPKDTEELKEFPGNLTGMYHDDEKDTLTITNNSFEYGIEKFLINGTLKSGRIYFEKK